MDRELPPGSRAAPPMRCGAFSRRAWKQVIGDILEHPWRWFMGFGLVSVLYHFVAATIRALAEPWQGSDDQSTAVGFAFMLVTTILGLALVWRRGGWAGVKKLLTSQWQGITMPLSERKWHWSMWVTIPGTFLVVIFFLILRG